MKKKYWALLSLGIFACLVTTGLLYRYDFTGKKAFENAKPVAVVRNELELLKDLDKDTISAYISIKDFYPDAEDSDELHEITLKIMEEFFSYFDYSVKNSHSSGDTATVDVIITTVDCRALVTDFYKAILSAQMDGGTEENSGETDYRFYYQILSDILSQNEYEQQTLPVTITLDKSEDNDWTIQSSDELKSALTGEFASYIEDEHLLTPSEIAEIILEGIKRFSADQLITYIGFEDIFSFGEEHGEDLDLLITEKILSCFDYHIISADTEDTQSQVSVNITSINMESVMLQYTEKLMAYSVTSDAILDSSEEKIEITYKLLYEALQECEDITTNTVTLKLTNSRFTWKFTLSEEFTDALTGGFSQAIEIFNERMAAAADLS